MPNADYTTRIRLLRAEIRDLCRQTDLYGTGRSIHRLRNYTGAAETACRMAEARLADNLPVEHLLDLAQHSLRRGRGLIVRIRLAWFQQNRRTRRTTG